MVDPSRTVFLSYRREVSWAMAHLVRNDLVAHGFDVFMDVGSIDSGKFEPVILGQIAVREHFLLLLEPRSLDRVTTEGDWLRREIGYALACDRNVVPLLASGARPPVASSLPPDLVRLPAYNALTVPPDYIDAAMQKLRDRFLRDSQRELTAPYLTYTQSFTGTDLEWTAVAGAGSYELVSAEYAIAIEGAAAVYRGTGHRFRKPPGKKSCFRVRALADSGARQGPWSNLVQVPPYLSRLGPQLAAPVLSCLPLLGSETLTWTRVNGASHYILQSSAGPTFTSPEIVKGYTGELSTTVKRAPHASYYRVRAVAHGGLEGPWSNVIAGLPGV